MKKDLHTKAHILHKKKRYKDAEKAYRKLERQHPNDPDILCSLGIISTELNNYDCAIAYFRKTIQIQPMHSEASHQLAKAYLAQGRYNLADEHFKLAIKIRGQNHLVYVDYAKLLKETGRPGQAKKHLTQAIKLAPTYADAYETLGEIHLQQGDFHAAIKLFEKALSINHNLPYSHECLGDCFFSLGYLENAKHQFQQAIKYSKRSTRPFLRLGSILLLLGETKESEECYKSALRIDKNNTEAIVGIANAQLQSNSPSQALNTIQPLLNDSVINDGLSHVYAKICLKLDTPEKAIDYLESSVNKTESHESMVHTYYALGKLEDHAKEYDKAFKYYETANNIVAYSYDAAGHDKSTDMVVKTLNHATLTALPRAQHDTRRPIFILGMPRSGTTLLEQIIASFSGVYGAGELNTLSNIAASIQNKLNTTKSYPEHLPDLTQDLVNELSNDYLNELNRFNNTAERITDKMPHNFVHLGLIELLFPQATVIHCVRNPLDTCISIYFQKFNTSHSYANNLTDLGMHYRQYLRLMNHWKKVLTIPIYDVEYESLISDLEGTSKKVADFCGIAWDAECLNFFRSGRFVNTASNEQVNKPIYSDSVERWRNYEKHIQPLISLLGH